MYPTVDRLTLAATILAGWGQNVVSADQPTLQRLATQALAAASALAASQQQDNRPLKTVDMSIATGILLEDGWHTIVGGTLTAIQLQLTSGGTPMAMLDGFLWQEVVNTVQVHRFCPASAMLGLQAP
jgi:hypothetical protein